MHFSVSFEREGSSTGGGDTLITHTDTHRLCDSSSPGGWRVLGSGGHEALGSSVFLWGAGSVCPQTKKLNLAPCPSKYVLGEETCTFNTSQQQGRQAASGVTQGYFSTIGANL